MRIKGSFSNPCSSSNYSFRLTTVQCIPFSAHAPFILGLADIPSFSMSCGLPFLMPASPESLTETAMPNAQYILKTRIAVLALYLPLFPYHRRRISFPVRRLLFCATFKRE